MPQPLISTSDLRRYFKMGDSEVHVLRGVSLSVPTGEFLAIEGRSGSGKSTLLHIMGALDEPTTGHVHFDGDDVFAKSQTERSRIRNVSFGFVFQFYHLLPELNVLENVTIASMVKHSTIEWATFRAPVRQRATELLDTLGLSHRLKHRPAQLSGGERQRVAIARALMNQPRVLFADEPTGNLDAETGGQIMRVLEALHAKGQTIIMVTHDRTIAKRADRAMVLKDGMLSDA